MIMELCKIISRGKWNLRPGKKVSKTKKTKQKNSDSQSQTFRQKSRYDFTPACVEGNAPTLQCSANGFLVASMNDWKSKDHVQVANAV